MPSFADSFDAMLEALETLGMPLPPASTDEPGISFWVITASLLSRMFAYRQASTAWQSFHEAGFRTPEIAASVTLAEMVEKTKSVPRPLKPLNAKTLLPLHQVSQWIVEHGGLDALDDAPLEELRDELIMMPGFSPAMTDAVLLYGLKRPVFPADGITYRIMARHGWIKPTANYEAVRDQIDQPAGGDVVVLAHLASWFDRVGQLYCKAKGAMCDGCPLVAFLPENGPCKADEKR